MATSIPLLDQMPLLHNRSSVHRIPSVRQLASRITLRKVSKKAVTGSTMVQPFDPFVNHPDPLHSYPVLSHKDQTFSGRETSTAARVAGAYLPLPDSVGDFNIDFMRDKSYTSTKSSLSCEEIPDSVAQHTLPNQNQIPRQAALKSKMTTSSLSYKASIASFASFFRRDRSTSVRAPNNENERGTNDASDTSEREVELDRSVDAISAVSATRNDRATASKKAGVPGSRMNSYAVNASHKIQAGDSYALQPIPQGKDEPMGFWKADQGRDPTMFTSLGRPRDVADREREEDNAAVDEFEEAQQTRNARRLPYGWKHEHDLYIAYLYTHDPVDEDDNEIITGLAGHTFTQIAQHVKKAFPQFRSAPTAELADNIEIRMQQLEYMGPGYFDQD